MYKAVIIRLFPDRQQEEKLLQSAGISRFVWNWALTLNKQTYELTHKTLSGYDMINEFTKLRRQEGYSWLCQVSCEVGYNAILDLEKAYKNFFRRNKTGLRGGFPRFKAKGVSIPSFCLSSRRVYMSADDRIYLMKIGHVKCKTISGLRGLKFWNTRIKYENGKWLLKCTVKQEDIIPDVKLSPSAMGIDVGVKSIAVLSMSGRKRVFRNINRSHRMRRLIRQLKHHQRGLSRKQKGSHNRLKTRYRVQKLFGKIKRVRHGYIYQTAAEIVKMKPSVIVMETLNIPAMMKNRHLARAISEQDWGLFRSVLERKAEQSGIRVMFADKFFPSSKKCSVCGHVREKLRLDERIYHCPECGHETDRDYNAAVNLENLAYTA
ncbi:MAG: transposase [Synergistaceae bacterium]|nr:transposase [Synergistaceae bacterium]